MREKLRHFELIQLLRAARRPVTAARLAAALEVTTRTIYRDIAALRALRVPVAGEAGVGYVLDAGFDLPPIAFDIEEVEALWVALAMLERTGDSGLKAAARRIEAKIDSALSPGGSGSAGRHRPSLVASDWGAAENPVAPMPLLHRAVREATRLEIRYRDEAGRETDRLVAPVALIYYVEAVVLAAWCSLRHDFRHFRTDRILACRASEPSFREVAAQMRAEWRLQFEGAPRQKP